MARGFGLVILIAAMLSALGTTACSHANSNAAEIARGKALYETNCAPCHELSSVPLPTQPPKLDGLFSKQNLPSGAPATDAQVRATIVNGRGVMPPFGPVLKDEDLDALIAYLHTK
ncbi:MAG: cytochrome c [Candidatus Acidiferrales bacterium]